MGTPAIVPAPITPKPEAANVASILNKIFFNCSILKYPPQVKNNSNFTCYNYYERQVRYVL
jgi:hypothetical protein